MAGSVVKKFKISSSGEEVWVQQNIFFGWSWIRYDFQIDFPLFINSCNDQKVTWFTIAFFNSLLHFSNNLL